MRTGEDGNLARYQIVGSDETDAGARRISMDSPLARALLGKREGDSVEVERPKGEITYAIVAIGYGAEPEG